MSLEKPNPKLLKERLYRTEECITKRRRLLFQHKLREQTLVGLDFRLGFFAASSEEYTLEKELFSTFSQLWPILTPEKTVRRGGEDSETFRGRNRRSKVKPLKLKGVTR